MEAAGDDLDGEGLTVVHPGSQHAGARPIVGIDVRQYYRPMPRGMGQYVRRLLRGLSSHDRGLDFHLYHEREAPADRDTLAEYFRERQLRFRGSRFELWERVRLPVALRFDRVALYHGTGNTLPPIQPCATVVTLHDTLLLEGEGDDPHAHYVRRAMPSALRKAKRILTDSEASARDIERVLDYPSENIRVIPLGVDEAFSPEREPGDDERIARFGVKPGEFLFALGAEGKRKNSEGLLAALALLRDELPRTVIAGFQPTVVEEFREAVRERGLQSRVRVHGYINDAELRALYRYALGFVFPSRREGFGLPVVEALASGTCVLCADRSSMPEIAEDAAIYFDPEDPASIARSIRELCSNDARRAELRRRGPDRSALFSWQRTAERTAEVYSEVLAEIGRGRPKVEPV